jgi:peptide/nickel transport system substrate-binding protein
MRRGLTVLASLTLATTALGGSVAAQSPAPDTSAVPGGTLVVGEWQPPIQLNPFFTSALTTTEAIGPVLHGLYNVNNDGAWISDLGGEIPSIENGMVVPNASGDGFTLTLTMKPGLKWSDGQKLDMNDFKFTYDWAVKTAQAGAGCSGCGTFVPLIDPTLTGDTAYAPENQYVKSIDVSEDGLTATVTWNKNYAGWLGWAGTWILPQHYVKDIPIDKGSSFLAVGSPNVTEMPWNGPFIITAASSDGIDYAPNPNYTADHAPYLEGLRFRYYGSKDGMITAFLNGEIDLALNMTVADYPAVAGVDASIGHAASDPQYAYEHLDLNTSHPGLSDPAVRLAIATGIDKQGILNVLFPGAGVEPGCSNSPGVWFHADVKCPAYDPAAAMKILDDAGWVVDTDDASPTSGLRVKDGVPLRFKMCTTAGNPTRLTTLGLLNQQLLAIGIPTTIETADASSAYFAGWADTTPDTPCSIYRGNYDLALFTYTITTDPYGGYFPLYHSTQIPSDAAPNGSNDTRISSPELDKAIEALGTEIDISKQVDAAKTVQEVMVKEIPEIVLYNRAETTGIGNHLGGFDRYNPSTAGALWDTQNWHFIP